MFGQEPTLPVDFLLGRVQEPIVGSVHESIQEHQSSLQVPFVGAQGWLKIMADRWNANHDMQAQDMPLIEDQLAYLWDYGSRDCHEIQDL